MPVTGFIFTLSVLSREAEYVTLQNTGVKDIQKAINDLELIKDRLSSLLPKQQSLFESPGQRYQEPTEIPNEDTKNAQILSAYMEGGFVKAKVAVIPTEDSKQMDDATRQAEQSAKINENLERLEEINAMLHSLGIDTKSSQDGSEITRLYLNKQLTPVGTMCSIKYSDIKNSLQETIKSWHHTIDAKRERLATLFDLLSPEHTSYSPPNHETRNRIEILKQKIKEDENSLAKQVLSLNQHLHSVRPINLKKFRVKFETLFNDRLQVLSDLRTLEVELAGCE
jgi:predicted RNA binding protein with dsRBD fold (UPF0201 family)